MSKISKLGVGIIAFEGLEHVKNIIHEIRDLTDYVVICLQKTSYHGDPIDDKDIDEAELLCELGYADNVIWFNPTNLHEDEPQAGPRLIETDKRNYILDYLDKETHCSHCLVIDSDEFYDHDDFKRAKSEIDSNEEIKVTYCQYINYYRDYQHLLVWPFHAYVPFITESTYRFSFKNGSFDKPSDPTRRYLITEPNGQYCILGYNVIKMHHLSWIRLDIKKKIGNWSAKKYFDSIDGLEKAILDRYENYEDGQNAIIMFNVPFYQVVVNKLPKQYIHPKFRLDQTPTKYLAYESSSTNNVN